MLYAEPMLSLYGAHIESALAFAAFTVAVPPMCNGVLLQQTLELELGGIAPKEEFLDDALGQLVAISACHQFMSCVGDLEQFRS